MISEVKIWIFVVVVSVLAAVLGFVIKTVMDQVIKKLDEIVSELKQLTKTSAIQEQQIRELQEQDKMIHHRLHDISGRLRTLELNANKS